MLEPGALASTAEPGHREGCLLLHDRLLRLAGLAPGIVKAIPDGQQAPRVTLWRHPFKAPTVPPRAAPRAESSFPGHPPSPFRP